MKKSTKLLSVLLAVLMILSSLSIAASAAKANYKTVANLESLSAYNNYGTVTRLSSEERFSIVLDELDRILAKANINMGTVSTHSDFRLQSTSVTSTRFALHLILSTIPSIQVLQQSLWRF